MKYFEGCKTIKQGTKKYRELMKSLHPDVGGNHEEVIEMQHQFEVFVKTATREEVEDKHPETNARTKQRSQAYIDTLMTVMDMNVKVEPIGDFIWVFETSPFDIFKLTALGFDYSKKHDGFYWTEIPRYKRPIDKDIPSPPKSAYSTEDLRKIWGSEVKRKKGYI